MPATYSQSELAEDTVGRASLALVLLRRARGIIGERVARIDLDQIVQDQHLQDSQKVDLRRVGMLRQYQRCCLDLGAVREADAGPYCVVPRLAAEPGVQEAALERQVGLSVWLNDVARLGTVPAEVAVAEPGGSRRRAVHRDGLDLDRVLVPVRDAALEQDGLLDTAPRL